MIFKLGVQSQECIKTDSNNKGRFKCYQKSDEIAFKTKLLSGAVFILSDNSGMWVSMLDLKETRLG